MSYYLEKAEGLSLNVRVQPRASRSGIELTPEGELRVRTTAPPVDSAANRAVQDVLAAALGVPRSRVKLTTGERSRNKVFLIEGEAAVLRAALDRHLRGDG